MTRLGRLVSRMEWRRELQGRLRLGKLWDAMLMSAAAAAPNRRHSCRLLMAISTFGGCHFRELTLW